MDEILIIRQGRTGDRNFILSTWLMGLYYGNPWFKEIEKDIFMANYHTVVCGLLERSAIVVAALKEDEDVILGYSVINPPVLHWIFVKEAWRKVGISKHLVPREIDVTTHLTVLGKKLKPKHMTFNPFLI